MNSVTIVRKLRMNRSPTENAPQNFPNRSKINLACPTPVTAPSLTTISWLTISTGLSGGNRQRHVARPVAAVALPIRRTVTSAATVQRPASCPASGDGTDVRQLAARAPGVSQLCRRPPGRVRAAQRLEVHGATSVRVASPATRGSQRSALCHTATADELGGSGYFGVGLP